MKETERRNIDDNIVEIYVINDEDNSEWKCYQIDKKKKEILCFIQDETYFVDTIYLDGFTDIPREFSEKGYIPAGVQYALNSFLKDKNINKFIISKENKKSFRKVKNGINITIPYNEFALYKQEMISIQSESQINRKKATNYFFATLFPKQFEIEEESLNRKKNLFLSGLDINIIPNLSKDELLKLQDFVFSMLDNRYIDVSKKVNLLSQYKENVDILVVDEAIKKFEENMAKNVSESDWGKYIERYLFLLETKYVEIIPELNLATCTWRKVDFAYIDYQGYMDLFEIKKPTTSLLCKSTDRGNYYWHADTVKAITQAEKYLFACERKASIVAEDIKRENGTDVSVIKPKAFLIIGTSNQLTNDNMKNDFKVLRDSLKNVEIILYDELLERFKNLKKRTFK